MLLNSRCELLRGQASPYCKIIKNGLICMLKSVIVFLPTREYQGYDSIGAAGIGGRTQEVSSQPTTTWSGIFAYYSNMDDQPQVTDNFRTQAELVVIHVDDIIDSICVDACGNVVSLRRQQ